MPTIIQNPLDVPVEASPIQAPEPMRLNIQLNVMVPMRDGARLCVDIYRPSTQHKGTLLLSTPYNSKTPWLMCLARKMAKQAFAVVVQNSRGRFGSEGQFRPFEDERRDGYDMLCWLASQSWTNRKIGLLGICYSVYSNYPLMAVTPPPGIEVVASVCCQELVDLFDLIYPAGVLRLHWALPWLELIRSTGNQNSGGNDVNGSHLQWQDVVKELPLISIEEKLGREIPTWSQWLKNPHYGKEWQEWSIDEDIARTTVPTMHVSGWFDPCLSQTIATFSKLRLRLNNQSLILGPWDHATLLHALVSSSLPPSGNASRGLPDHYPLFTRVMEWFDHWFGESSSQDFTAGPPVEFYELSTNQWRQAKEWPPAEARWAKIYIAPGGYLDAARPEEEGWQGYIYDPINPVPTLGGDVFPFGDLKPGSLDQGPVEFRSDAVVFTGEPLKKPLVATGPLHAVLYVSSSAPDTDFTVKVTDAYPDGRSQIVRDGIFRMRYLESRSKPRFITPGAVYRINLALGDISYRFEAGHRIKVIISSSNFPKFDRNLNIQEAPESGTSPVRAQQKIYWGGLRASFLHLPVANWAESELCAADLPAGAQKDDGPCARRLIWR